MAKPTALHSWWNSDLDTRPHSVLSYSIAVFPKVKYRENGAGSWAKPYIQDINCCCHPRRGEGCVDPSSHIRIISQLLQTRKWNGCIHLEGCEQLQSWMSGVAPHNAYMWAWTHSRVCPTRFHARLQKLWRTSAVCGEIVKSAAHASVPLINQPLQESKGIYILLMLCTARDAQISLLYTLTRIHSCT